MVVSGILPFLDNILVWKYPGLETLKDQRGGLVRNNIWILALYSANVCIILGAVVKAHVLTFQFPLYASLYSGTMYFLMMKGYDINPDWYHRVGMFILVLPFTYLLFRLHKRIQLLRLRDEVFIDSLNEYVNED